MHHPPHPPPSDLLTPIYVKSDSSGDFPAYDDPVYYVLARDGLFIGRNTANGAARFQSIVPAPRPPAELAAQSPGLVLDYPKLSAGQVARIVGFFGRIALDHRAEALVLLALDDSGEHLDLIVPPQIATVGRTWGGATYAIDVKYTLMPADGPLPTIIGDVHSHVYQSAYASNVDRNDEQHAPGLHLVIGHVHREPPSFHADFVADGTRFRIEPEEVLDLAGYRNRDRDTPPAWIEQVEIVTVGPAWADGHRPDHSPTARDAARGRW